MSTSAKSISAPTAGLLDKAKAAAERVAAMRTLAHDAQIREALSRTEMTLALGEALLGRAEAEQAARQATARLYFAANPAAPLRHRTPQSDRTDRYRLRLGARGQAQLIALSGVWRTEDAAAIEAYVRRGGDPAAQPHCLFDQAAYLAAYPELAGGALAPLTHYLIHGPSTGVSPHPLLDAAVYAETEAADLARRDVTLLEHFVRRGARLGRNPHPLFDITHYVGQSPDLAVGEDPVSHYLRAGWRAGLSPHPLFDTAWVQRQTPREAAEIPPLLHYIREGWRSGISPHPLFDTAWYLQQNADVAEAGVDPLTHFVRGGAAEGRNPGPWFDVAHYLAQRGGALTFDDNPLVDYLKGGAWLAAEARPGFPSAAYLATTPELARRGMTPLEHWARKSVAG